MINVNYKNRIGYFTQIENHKDGVRKFRFDICHANCLCAIMNFYKDENGEDMAQLVSFFADIQHAKRFFKEYNDTAIVWDNFVFNAKECDTEMWKFIRLLADNGKKIRIK